MPPKITPFTFGDEAMNSGEPVSIHCTISGGDLPVNVMWILNGNPIDPFLKILTEKHGKRIHNLMIDSVSHRHAGNYTCIAKNSAGIAQHSSELIVNGWFGFISFFCCCLFIFPLVPPKIVPFSFGDEPSSFGDSASVQCSVTTGDFPIDIVWLLNGKEIKHNLQVSISKFSKRLHVLSIDAVTDSHMGNYTCVASNLAGASNHTSVLIVNGIYIILSLG